MKPLQFGLLTEDDGITVGMSMSGREDSPTKFIRDFRSSARKLGGNIDVVVIGSLGTKRWCRGVSDVDILVYIHGQQCENLEIYLYRLYRFLDLKYNMELSKVPFLHPPIIFIHNSVENILIEGILKEEFPAAEIKDIFRRIMPPTHLLLPFLEKNSKFFNLPILFILYTAMLFLKLPRKIRDRLHPQHKPNKRVPH